MSDTSNILIGAVAGAIVLGAVISSLLLVGGPESARIETSDYQLRSDLIAVKNLLVCRKAGRALPSELTVETLETLCGMQLTTAEIKLLPLRPEITYTRLSDEHFRLCGEFQKLEGLRANSFYDKYMNRSTGCVESAMLY